MTHVTTQSYTGPDRRRNRVYVTNNHEYHCKDGICVAVRDTRGGAFLEHHTAIGKQASAAVILSPSGIQSIALPDEARPGERMHFATGVEDPNDVLTSPIRAIERPAREIADGYDRRNTG